MLSDFKISEKITNNFKHMFCEHAEILTEGGGAKRLIALPMVIQGHCATTTVSLEWESPH